MVEFRDYQKQIINQGVDTINQYGFVYLAMEVRTGKTLTSLGIAEKLGCTDVLFLTKKKAIRDVENDNRSLSSNFSFFCINYESMHKLPDYDWDLVI